MSAPTTALEKFIDGATKVFLENPSVATVQLIVGMANTIRENTTPPPPCLGGCCPEVPPDGGDIEAGPEATACHEDGLAEGETEGEEMYDSDEGDDHLGECEVVPMSGVDVGKNFQLSNIHGYKELYLPMSRYGHVMGEGVLPSGVGCAWLPSEEERNTEWTQCTCVRAGKIHLVVAKTPDELCQEHCAGDWCPCQGMQKKWIYRHFGTLDVSHFERHASKQLIDMWQLVRRVADPDGWVSYGTIREYFLLQNYNAQCQAFYKLRDVWKILTPSDIPEKSSWCFQLKPQFR